MAQNTDHKESRATVRVVYRTTDTQRDGTNPFFICITKQRKRKYIATGETLDPKYWDETKQAIRKSYPSTLKYALEKRLKDLVEKYEKAAITLAEADEQHDVKTVASKAVESRKQTRKTTLLAYIDELVDGMVKARKTGNSIVYRDLRNQLAKFIEDEYDVSDISFDKVNVKFCNEWENSLRATGIADTTLSNRFRTLRSVLNRAISNGYAKPESYPFARTVAEKHKFSVGKFDTSTRKRAISREDIRKVENFTPVGTATGKWASIKNEAEIERLLLARAVFLFSFYCGGINFVDLAKLRWCNINTNEDVFPRLKYTRQKTGGKFSMRLLEPAETLINQYRHFTYKNQNSYIFPILNAEHHITEAQINNRLHKILGQVNKDLKTIGERVNIDTPLTTYVARHSFATSLRRAGINDAVTSQIMGHKNETVTTIYLDDFGSDIIDTALDALL